MAKKNIKGVIPQEKDTVQILSNKEFRKYSRQGDRDYRKEGRFDKRQNRKR